MWKCVKIFLPVPSIDESASSSKQLGATLMRFKATETIRCAPAGEVALKLVVPLAPVEFIMMKNSMISFSNACFLLHDEAAAESGQDL